jgi:hypothetical protein
LIRSLIPLVYSTFTFSSIFGQIWLFDFQNLTDQGQAGWLPVLEGVSRAVASPAEQPALPV